MIDDAIKSLRTLFLSSLGIIVLWFFMFPQAAATFRLYDAAQDLYAWTLLNETFEELEMYIFEVPPSQIVREVEFEGIISARGDDGILKVPIEVTTAWPEIGVYPIALVPKTTHDQVRIYGIDASALDFLPVSSYQVVFSSVPKLSGTFVVSAEAHDSLDPAHVASRQIASAAQSLHLPRSWNIVAPYLLNLGFAGDPTELDSRHTPVRTFLATVDAAIGTFPSAVEPTSTIRGVKIFGLEISISVFFSSVGVLLATIAFAMIGPVRGIRLVSGREERQAWIMTTPYGCGFMGWLLEGLVILATFIWAISPVCIMLLQLTTGLEVEAIRKSLLVAGALGLVVSSSVFLVVASQLRHYRKVTALTHEG
ncbi:hypothetical protein ACFL5Z_03955 [Planctomycetota bacterium]